MRLPTPRATVLAALVFDGAAAVSVTAGLFLGAVPPAWLLYTIGVLAVASVAACLTLAAPPDDDHRQPRTPKETTAMTDDAPETARLTADTVLLADHDHLIHVLLIRRAWPPFEGCWALPGGHVDTGEDTEGAARRELEEETGLTGGPRFHLVGVYAEPGRDPRGRYVDFAYVTWTTGLPQPTAADDAAEARWMPVDDLLAGDTPLAFDHRRIISDAMRRLY